MKKFILMLLLCTTIYADSCINSHEKKLLLEVLEKHNAYYGDVTNYIQCNENKSTLEMAVCKDEEYVLMFKLLSQAWVYAYENATKREVNHQTFTQKNMHEQIRNYSSKNKINMNTLCADIKEVTGDALGDETPYADRLTSFIDAARVQVGKTITYNPEYVTLPFPMGDINITKGVCTDVVVRAMRGVDIDLQERIYNHKKKYPQYYKGLYSSNKLNPSIDHRRVKNIQAYLTKRGYQVKDTYKSGDIVVWKVSERFDHIGICSSKLNDEGEPFIIHNIGSGAKEEDVLREYKIIDHFRVFDRENTQI